MAEARIFLRVLGPDGTRVPQLETHVELQPLWDLDSLIQMREGVRSTPRLNPTEGCTEVAVDAPFRTLFRVGLQWGNYDCSPEDQYVILRPLDAIRLDLPSRERRAFEGLPERWARRDAVILSLLNEGCFGAIRGRWIRPRADRYSRPKIHVMDVDVPLRRGEKWDDPSPPGYLWSEMLFDEDVTAMDWVAVPVRPGRKRIFIVDPIAVSWSKDLEVRGGELVDVGVVSPSAATGRFEVQVVDPEGRPRTRVQIHAHGRDPAYLGEDGEYQLQLGPWIKRGPEPIILEPIPPETTRMRLEIWRSGGEPVRAVVEVKAGFHTMTLPDTTQVGMVEGVVVDEDGRRVNGYSVQSEPIQLYSGCMHSPEGSFKMYGLEVSQPTVKLKVTCPGYESAIIDAPMNANDLRIVLRKSADTP